MTIKITPIIPCLLLLTPTHSFSAQQAIDPALYRTDTISVNAAIGYLSGQSNEYVYTETGRTLSELNWSIDGAPIIKGSLMLDVSPKLTANLNAWSSVDTSNATMDDYDWIKPTQSAWTDWSHHDDTDLHSTTNIDFNMQSWFLQNQHYKLGAMAGYERMSFDFEARGGCYQYNSGSSIGCFPDHLPMIGYEQTFESVYLGLTGKYLINNVELNANVKFGPWVQASDVDQHYARDIVFTENGDNSLFSSVTLAAGYYATPHTKLFFEAVFNQFTNGKADMEMEDSTATYFIKDAAGLSNTNYILALGVQYILGS